MKQVGHYSARPYNERFFAELVLPKRPGKCDVLIRPMKDENIYVYTQDQFGPMASFSEPISYTAIASFALSENAGVVGGYAVSPKEDVAEGYLTLDFSGKITDSDLVGIVVRPENDMQLGVLLNDKFGESHWRDYNNLKEGADNIVLLSMADLYTRNCSP